jgi:hypothetical protein
MRVTALRAGTAVGARATTRATDGARALGVTGDVAWRRLRAPASSGAINSAPQAHPWARVARL